MAVPEKEYNKMAKKASPSSPMAVNIIKAFLIGGLICALGEGLFLVFRRFGVSEDNGRTLVSITLIVITAILTTLGVFDKIAKHRICKFNSFTCTRIQH